MYLRSPGPDTGLTQETPAHGEALWVWEAESQEEQLECLWTGLDEARTSAINGAQFHEPLPVLVLRSGSPVPPGWYPLPVHREVGS